VVLVLPDKVMLAVMLIQAQQTMVAVAVAVRVRLEQSGLQLKVLGAQGG
jgi:hypothetical protein